MLKLFLQLKHIYKNTCPLRVRFSEMHEKHPKSSDTMETRPVTPHFYFDFSPRIQLSCSIGSFMKIICGNQIVMFPFKGVFIARTCFPDVITEINNIIILRTNNQHWWSHGHATETHFKEFKTSKKYLGLKNS